MVPPPSRPLLLIRDDLLQRLAVGAVEPLLRAQEVLGEVELRLHQLGERQGRRGRQPVGSRRRSCKSCFDKIRCPLSNASYICITGGENVHIFCFSVASRNLEISGHNQE